MNKVTWIPPLIAQVSIRKLLVCVPRSSLDTKRTAGVTANQQIVNRQLLGGGEGIRTPDPRVANAVLCQLSYTPFEISDLKLEIQNLISDLKSKISISGGWLRGRDLNPRPLGYEPNELPDCSTPRQ